MGRLAEKADPQLGEIASAAGLDIFQVRSAMNWLLAIAVEAVSCFGLFAIAWAREARASAVMETERAGSARPWRLVKLREAGDAPAVIDPPARKSRRSAARKAGPGNGGAPRALPWPREVGHPDAEA